MASCAASKPGVICVEVARSRTSVGAGTLAPSVVSSGSGECHRGLIPATLMRRVKSQ